MYARVTPKAERRRILTEREYREWQMSLRSNMPVKRLKTGPGFLTRLASTIRRGTARRTHPVAAPRHME